MRVFKRFMLMLLCVATIAAAGASVGWFVWGDEAVTVSMSFTATSFIMGAAIALAALMAGALGALSYIAATEQIRR